MVGGAAIYKDSTNDFLNHYIIGHEIPDDPPTEAEKKALIKNTGSRPILDIIAEYKRPEP